MGFDPYETWLGIPPDRRPPTHYDLLGLAPYESDPATIDQAALRRMSKVRQHQIGPHSDQSQEILSELARARLILMDPDRRTDYDAKLRARSEGLPVRSSAPEKLGNGDATLDRPDDGTSDVFASLALTEQAAHDRFSLRSNLNNKPPWRKRGLVLGAVLASLAVLLGAFYCYVISPPSWEQKLRDLVRNNSDRLTPTQKPRTSVPPARKPVVTPKPAAPVIVQRRANHPGGGGERATPSFAALDGKDKDVDNPSGPGRVDSSGMSADPKGRTAQTNSGPTRVADGKVPGFIPKAGAAGAVERKKSEARWRKVLLDLHNNGLHARGSETTKRRAREKAEAELDKIDDPAAVPAIWSVFAGKPSHDQLLVRMLARIKSPGGTKMLAYLSVYSPDEKARRLATNAENTRPH